MNDRELLELAAKAAGIEVIRIDEPGAWIAGGGGVHWNPLTDDGDALRLAVSLKFQIIIYKDWVEILQDGIRVMNADSVYYAGCMIETTRRAIVRAAAAIGEAMQ